MKDFNSYSKNGQGTSNGGIEDYVKSIAQQYDGKNQSELLKAIYEQALNGKRKGTLTNEQIDGFAKMLSPMLDSSQRCVLEKVVAELKKI